MGFRTQYLQTQAKFSVRELKLLLVRVHLPPSLSYSYYFDAEHRHVTILLVKVTSSFVAFLPTLD